MITNSREAPCLSKPKILTVNIHKAISSSEFRNYICGFLSAVFYSILVVLETNGKLGSSRDWPSITDKKLIVDMYVSQSSAHLLRAPWPWNSLNWCCASQDTVERTGSRSLYIFIAKHARLMTRVERSIDFSVCEKNVFTKTPSSTSAGHYGKMPSPYSSKSNIFFPIEVHPFVSRIRTTL